MYNQKKAIQVQAATLADAVKQAATNLGVAKERVKYEVVAEQRGLLSLFMGKKTTIRAWAESSDCRSGACCCGTSDVTENSGHDDEESDGVGRGAQVPKRVLSADEIEDLVDDLKQFWAGMCERISGNPVEVTAELSDGRLVLDVDDEYLASQMVRNSKLAEALENVIRKKPRHLKQELPFRVFVDARSTRRQREIELIEMAHEMSNQVHTSQHPIVLNNRSAYDRKIIHMALDKDQRVFTKSIGSGPARKLMILPARGGEATRAEADG